MNGPPPLKTYSEESFRPLKLERLKLAPELEAQLYEVTTLGDGSCFFHAVLRSFSQEYRDAPNSERTLLARRLRNFLADKLEETNPATGLTCYEELSNGRLEDYAMAVPSYTVEALQAELRSSAPTGDAYLELISNVLEKDVYIVNKSKGDVYTINSALDLFYKRRSSIVVIYDGSGHYTLLGLRNKTEELSTHYAFDHPLIQSLQRRIRELIPDSSS